MMTCRKFLVEGKVQGVFFRASTQSQARQLNLTGHAINLPDGRVEVLACGEPGDLDQLEGWLQEGPPMADVRSVSTSHEPCDDPPGSFVTR